MTDDGGVSWGLTEQVIARIYCVLESFPEIGKVILYGSRAKGNYRKGSDIDLTLVPSEGHSLGLETIYRLDEALDDLMLPYSFDLSVMADIDNSNLVSHIKRMGVVFWER